MSNIEINMKICMIFIHYQYLKIIILSSQNFCLKGKINFFHVILKNICQKKWEEFELVKKLILYAM